MTDEDRALIGWGRGVRHTRSAAVGPFVVLTKNYIYDLGVPTCVRYKDVLGRACIFIRKAQAARGIIIPEKHFKGRRWCWVSDKEFTDLITAMNTITGVQKSDTLTFRNLESVGEALRIINQIVAVAGIDFAMAEITTNNRVLLGAKFLLKGRKEALCCRRSFAFEDSYTLFDKLEDAVTMKMRYDGVELYEI